MSSSAKASPARWSKYWLLGIVAVLGLAVLLYSVHGTRQRSPLHLGQPSPQTFTAPVDTQVIDWIATQRERQAARAQIETVFTSDPELESLVLAAVGSSGLPPTVVDAVISRYQDPSGVRADAIPDLIASAALLAPEDRQREARLVLERRLVATSVPNDRLTQAARDAAAGAVPSVMQSLEAGQVIVREGEPLDEDVLRVLDSLGLYSAQADAVTQTVWIVIGCLVLALLLASPLFIARQRLMDRLTPTQVAFLVALTLLTLGAQRLAVLASPHFLFALLAAMTVSVLLGLNAGLLWAAWLALAVGLMVPASPLLAMAATLVGSVVASLVVQTLRTRVALPVAGAAGGLVAGATMLAIVIMSGGLALSSASAGAAFLFGGGLLAGVVALGLLPVAESVFGFLTDFRLLELSSPSERLMQRLIAEAPGTYQHSLVISNLVEQAVKNIGGDSLLARVGALYHDVGKTRRPQFFIENQFTGENPHDRLSPHLSYLIVISHVRDGIDLAREYGLPRELEPFIAEHHGTTVLSYFYKRALEEGQVEELNFRYPGPKPQSKETAVLMLADAVESASRTLEDPSPSTIRALIDRLFEQRRQEEQFAESPLNFNDLEVIASTFERMLTAVLHRRITYPSAEELRGLRSTRSGAPAAHAATSKPPGRAEAGEVDADGRGSGRDVPVPTR